MNNKNIVLIACGLLLSIGSYAQTAVPKEKMTAEEKQEKSEARASRVNAKNDYSIFRKQAVALKEFSDEKKKAPKLQADSKMPVKVVVAIDSLEEGDNTTKVLTGYIVQTVGDNTTQLYDLTFDRKEKKIITVKKTAEAIDADKEEADEKAEKKADKAGAKPAVHKKSKDDDDDDEPAEKPGKKDKDDE